MMSTPAPEADQSQKKTPNSSSIIVRSRLPHWSFFLTQLFLRAAAAASTLVAIFVMVTSRESVVIFGFTLKARYHYSSSLRFLLGVDSAVLAFSVLSAAFLCGLSRSGEQQSFRHYFLLFLHDLVMTVLMISGCSAATAIGYVSRYGEDKMGWHSVCNWIEYFCNRVLVSVVLSYLAFFCYFALTITSAHKVALLSSRH
ncbi:hypothetical protein SAY86_013519 [Trapa natans]|uniref:CASP-like protein n=1 Tax=Trapa natans TaxID=22666 RepID=A0AAN7KSI4_TRANT|nr:hypothetical protein SAY86_013519 [Trapa natans]